MPTRPAAAILAFAAFGLAACGDTTPGSGMAGTGAAERACVTALNAREVVGGRQAPASVTGASFGDPVSTVQLIDGNGARWTCRATNDGSVESLAVL